MCGYYEAISELLEDGEEATVVMTTQKGNPPGWDRWNLDRDEEAVIKDRFRDPTDPLKILIVTAKLLTGFNAPPLVSCTLTNPCGPIPCSKQCAAPIVRGSTR